jgi:RNA polymerase sigma-70 factor (ECF subfamily)
MVDRVLAGDDTAFRGLVEKYQERLYTMAYGVLRNREDARDVTQDAFIKAYRSLSSFRRESSFYTWLYRIGMNLSIDLTRKRKRRESGGLREDVATRNGQGGIHEIHHQDSPQRVIERRQLYDQIMDAMDQLPEDQKQVILLRELEGMSYREIAEVMDVAEGTIMSRLYYARKKLQQLLSGAKP